MSQGDTVYVIMTVSVADHQHTSMMSVYCLLHLTPGFVQLTTMS